MTYVEAFQPFNNQKGSSNVHQSNISPADKDLDTETTLNLASHQRSVNKNTISHYFTSTDCKILEASWYQVLVKTRSNRHVSMSLVGDMYQKTILQILFTF